MNDWTKWLLTTTILSMSLAPAAGYAAENTEGQAPAPEGITFTDYSKISKDKVQAVQAAVEQGLLNGFPDGRFDPKKTLSRQELAVILAKALHLVPETMAESSFSDTPQAWAVPYIEAVRKAGLMSGDRDNAFRPSDPVTNEELAAVFVRAVQGVGATGETADGAQESGNVSAWAKEAFAVSEKLGLVVPDEGTLDPKGNVEREDIAAFLIEIFKNEERTAVINAIDGDFVTIDGKPMLIDDPLKALFAGKNKDALEGAILKYTLLNKNVDGLAELEIVKGGSDNAQLSLDTTGSSFNGVLRVSGDNLSVTGGSLAKVEVKPGVKKLDLNAGVEQLSVLTEEPLALTGDSDIKSLRVESGKARITLGEGVLVDKVEVPSSNSISDIISNYARAKEQIKNRPAEPAPVSSQDSNSSPRNQAPAASVTAINPASGVAGGAAVTVDLSGTFEDEAVAGLTYSAVSNGEAIATVSVTGTTLTLTPIAAGTATVTLTAEDAEGLTGTRTFDFTVEAAPVVIVNAPPAASAAAITAAVGVAGGAAVTVDLSGTFEDENAASLTYSAVSANETVATVSVTGTTLTLTPVAIGTVSITVTAEDAEGLTGTRSFDFTVEAAPVVIVNEPPAASASTISPEVGYTNGDDVTVELTGTFEDEDAASLTYSAVSADETVATVSVTGTTLALTPVAAGTVTITVTAEDTEGLTGTRTFDFTVETAQVDVELQDGAVLYATADSTIKMNTTLPSVGYQYSKRNLLDLIKLTYKGDILTNASLQYDSTNKDYNVMEGSNHIADLKLVSSDNAKLAVVGDNDIQLDAESTLAEGDDIEMTFSVETIGGSTDSVTLDVIVDNTAPTITNLTANDDNTAFTVQFSEPVILQNDGGGLETIAYHSDGTDATKRVLTKSADYDVSFTPGSNQLVISLTPDGILNASAVNGSTFSFVFGNLLDYADHDVSTPYVYTVVIDDPDDGGGGIPGDSGTGIPGDSGGGIPGDSGPGIPGDSGGGIPGDSGPDIP